MLIDYKNISIYQKDYLVLEDVTFHAHEGEFIFLTGVVGSGKSSLLKTIYAELPATGGEATVLGHDMSQLKRKHVPELRKQLGIVFQDFQLLNDRTVMANLEFVLRATGWKKKEDIEARIKEVMQMVELEDKLDSFPHELSGGEQQRVAIARALLNSPKILLADEPTGNLDRDTSCKILNILRNVCESGATVIMSTHNMDLVQQFPGIVYRCENKHISEVTKEYNRPIEIQN